MIDNEAKTNQIKVMFFTLKVLSLLFAAIPMFQFFYSRFHISENDYFSSIYSVGTVLIILFGVVLLWTSLPSIQPRNRLYQVVERVFFFAVFVFAIYISGAEHSHYKFLFLFLIIIYTIEYGMKTGLMIGTVSSLIVLLIDVIFGGISPSYEFFQNDLVLSAMFVIVAWTLGFYVKLEHSHIEKLTEYANIDGLTGLYNHRFFHKQLDTLCRRYRSENRELSLLIFDIDYFKSYNDIYGHQKGDELLRQVSALIKNHLRAYDLFCRYGGDEFCVILPDTSKETASAIAQRLRELVSDHPLEGQEYMPNANLTISVGVSALNSDVDSYTTLIDHADTALYRAKFLRRNRVEVYSSVVDQFSEFDSDRNVDENIKSLKTLITVINSRDTYTYKHVERVVDYCRLMADQLELDIERKKCLIYSAYLHDLGKINIQKEVLITENKLTDEQWAELKRHPVDGAGIISQIDGFAEMVPVVLQHHEKFDGTGYPNGLSGENINYLARILTIIDSFDAMTNHRPYQKIKTFDEAFAEIERCKGTHFDPVLVDNFIGIMKSQ